ncbi:MAG: nickel-responsive transcriptional regulator NikR [Spirochaetes bacterium]|nr:nickel-responsive transcriptional regulator NikR [Spirochaetota bacterium]
MSELIRFGISLDKKLLESFDKHIRLKGYPTRSKAVSDLIRGELVKKEWVGGSEVAGSITMVYDHHKRDLVNTLTSIQHDFHNLIVSSQHVHLDHDNCLEIVIAKGKAKMLSELGDKLNAVKGVKHVSLSMTTTGKNV